MVNKNILTFIDTVRSLKAKVQRRFGFTISETFVCFVELTLLIISFGYILLLDNV